jgi:hypothetical protein
MAGLGTHVAIERAALVTPSLKSGAPRSYPNTFSPADAGDKGEKCRSVVESASSHSVLYQTTE